MNKSPAVFDVAKLRWMNGEYIKKMDPENSMRKLFRTERGSEERL